MSELEARTPIEIDTEIGYRLWADSYDDDRNNALILAEEPVVADLLEGLPIKTALDAGAGTGRHSLRLARQGVSVTALDASPEMLAALRSAAAKDSLRIAIDLGSLEEPLPYADGQFDLSLCCLVLTHLADFRPVLAELSRVLRPGGYLLISDFHPDIVTAGARTTFSRDDSIYALPNPPHSRADYLSSVRDAPMRILRTVDIPLSSIPPTGPESESKRFRARFGDRDVCLVVLAGKPA